MKLSDMSLIRTNIRGLPKLITPVTPEIPLMLNMSTCISAQFNSQYYYSTMNDSLAGNPSNSLRQGTGFNF